MPGLPQSTQGDLTLRLAGDATGYAIHDANEPHMLLCFAVAKRDPHHEVLFSASNMKSLTTVWIWLLSGTRRGRGAGQVWLGSG
jgi:hypothetical protein